MAAADKVSITITGRGGHAAMPHLCVDPIAIGCQLVSTLQTLVSRATDPTDAVVFSVTQFHAGSAHNVIPVRQLRHSFGAISRAFLSPAPPRPTPHAPCAAICLVPLLIWC